MNECLLHCEAKRDAMIPRRACLHFGSESSKVHTGLLLHVMQIIVHERYGLVGCGTVIHMAAVSSSCSGLVSLAPALDRLATTLMEMDTGRLQVAQQQLQKRQMRRNERTQWDELVAILHDIEKI